MVKRRGKTNLKAYRRQEAKVKKELRKMFDLAGSMHGSKQRRPKRK